MWLQGKLQPEHVDRSWSSVWQQNMQSRDFTVNALMYDPVSHLLYDYVGGFSDCHRRRLHSLGDPYVSLAEDPPRILRAIRLSARTGELAAQASFQCCQVSMLPYICRECQQTSDTCQDAATQE